VTRDAVYTFIDLFCGAGGFTEGMLLAGGAKEKFRLLVGSDIHENASDTYQHRFGKQLGIDHRFLRIDIREPNFSKLMDDEFSHIRNCPDVDVVVGGPPCQGFSVFGARNQDDPRNDLFKSYLKAISALSPKYFVMENVPGLQKMYSGEAVREIHKLVSQMKKPSYRLVGPIPVNAANYGAPQLRDRIIFVGSRADMPLLEEPLFAARAQITTVREALGDLSFLRTWQECARYEGSHPAVTDYQVKSRKGRLFAKYGFRRDDDTLTNHDAARHSPEVIARFAMILPGQGTDSIPRPL
jgi:DNA (cytosine-5)-methyltransferase 1